MLQFGMRQFGFGRRPRGGGFNLAQLANAVAIYEPWDLTSLFQEVTGETQVSANNDPCHLILDKSQMGGKTGAAFRASQPELVTNGGFDTDLSGWTLSQTATAGVPTWDAGSMKMNSDGTGFSRADQELTTVANVPNIIEVNTSGANIRVKIGASQGAGTFYDNSAVSAGVTYIVVTPTGTSTWVRFEDGSGTANSVLSVSSKAIPGNHFALLSGNPLYQTASGLHWIYGDGVDDALQALFIISQPWWRVSAIEQLSWTVNERIFGGGNANAGVLYQKTSTPLLGHWSGAALGAADEAPLTTPVVVEEFLSGASSTIGIDNNAPVTGNAGTTVPGGITLFASDTGGLISNARFYGGAMGSGSLPSNIAQAKVLLASKAGVAL